MVCETRSSRRLLRSVAVTKRLRFLALDSQGKGRTRRLRVVTPRISEQNSAVCEDAKDSGIPPEYDWIRVIHVKHGDMAMKLLMEMARGC